MASGGKGGRPGGRLSWDDRLALRAIREAWDVPAEKRVDLVLRLMAIATDPDGRPRDSTAAARALLEASRISLEAVRVAAYATRPVASPVQVTFPGPGLSPELAKSILAIADGGGPGAVPSRPGLPPPVASPPDEGAEAEAEADAERAAALVDLAREGVGLTDDQQCAVLELLCGDDDPFPEDDAT